METLNGLNTSLLGHLLKSAIKSALSNTLFAAEHNYVDCLTDNIIAVTWIRKNISLKIALLS
jgi:hypothetical protein